VRDLNFDHVSLYYGHCAALADVTLRCPGGRVTCLVGPNGAGKSSVLAAAAGMIRLQAGRITAGAREIIARRHTAGVSYLPQNSAFARLQTAREVLDFAASVSGAGASRYAAALDATGVDEILGRRVGELSGGWERRLGLAWALLQPADVLLLDEPLVGLDPETLDRIVDHLGGRAAEGATVVMATHEFEAVDTLAPVVAVLNEGRVVARFEPGSGSLRELYRAAMTDASLAARRMSDHALAR
jgi:ABC-type multidrug transport system ATPase subunit